MGRPPVRPEDRKRAAKACIACRATKKRCDGGSPCQPCVNRGNASSCEYLQRASRNPHRSRPTAAATTLTRPGQRNATPVSLDGRSSSRSSHGPDSPSLSRVRQHFGTRSRNSAAASYSSRAEELVKARSIPGPRPVMMHTCSGEKVFVGNASAISFLQFLRGSLSTIFGSNGFTISHNGHRMFEAQQVPVQPLDSFQDDIEHDEKRELIQLFMDASSGLLDLFDRSEIEQLVVDTTPTGHLNTNEAVTINDPSAANNNNNNNNNSSSSSSSSRNNDDKFTMIDNEGRICCLYMMIAIGAQCRGRQPTDSLKAFRYFSEARKLSFQGFLTDLTLNMARAFVLMAFYMFGACRRNAAFMYLGIATKAASVLGLHMSDQFQSLSKEERGLRSRIDRSIRLFDVVCSSMLGRPTSSSGLPNHRALSVPRSLHGEAQRSQSVAAACQFSGTLNDIVEKLSSDGCLGLSTAESFLEDIRRWSSNLPRGLRRGLRQQQVPVSGTCNRVRSSLDRETNIGNIHVACTYYFGVITTTREFLIQHVMSRLVILDDDINTENNSRSSYHDSVATDIELQEEKKVTELAKVCVDAAAYMAEMCSEALDTGVIMGNMCILKAWLFAAGLILGFSLLDSEVVASYSDRPVAFRSTLRVLEFLARSSPQAGQYHRVLSSFSQALESYKLHSLQKRNRSTTAAPPPPPYVERLLSLHSPEGRSRHDLNTNATCTWSNGGDPARRTVADIDSGPVDGAGIGAVGLENPFGSPQLDLDHLDFGGEDLILSLLWEEDCGTFTASAAMDVNMAIYSNLSDMT